jgi:hypothetical protein
MGTSNPGPRTLSYFFLMLLETIKLKILYSQQSIAILNITNALNSLFPIEQ